MTAFRYTIAAAMGLLLAVPATSQATGIACGTTITANTKLRADLTNCPGDGLVIGADRITLDLGRYTIDGTGNGAGIRLAGRRNVTIKGGTVREFATGLALDEQLRQPRVGDDDHGRRRARRRRHRRRRERLRAPGLPRQPHRARADGLHAQRDPRSARFTGNAITGVLLFGATDNDVQLNRFADNVGNGVAAVEGANGNTIAANAVERLADRADRRRRAPQPADAQQDRRRRRRRAGRRRSATPSRSTLVDRSVGGCEGCSGWGIGVTVRRRQRRQGQPRPALAERRHPRRGARDLDRLQRRAAQRRLGDPGGRGRPRRRPQPCRALLRGARAAVPGRPNSAAISS